MNRIERGGRAASGETSADVRCRLCGGPTVRLFEKVVLGRYRSGYHQCADCGLTQTDPPTWLAEAYTDAIVPADTGLLARNLAFRGVAGLFLHFSGARGRPCLDWAGGYGVFTRLMRDAGFDFHWLDRYARNLFARGFEWRDELGPPFAITALEVLEHLPRPLEGFREIAGFGADYILTSTVLASAPRPSEDWWYLVPETGQHVAFYSAATLLHLGRACGYPFVLAGPSCQVFARRPFPAWWWHWAARLGPRLEPLVRRLRRPLTEADRRSILAAGRTDAGATP